MKIKYKSMFIALVLGLIFLFVMQTLKKPPYIEKQEQLADILGVKLEDYRQVDFPRDYFSQTLKPGITISEVHNIVIGYEKVLKCGDWAEVYYFFNSSDEEAFRYKILYVDGFYDSFIVDDFYDSMKISLSGCTEGLLSN